MIRVKGLTIKSDHLGVMLSFCCCLAYGCFAIDFDFLVGFGVSGFS